MPSHTLVYNLTNHVCAQRGSRPPTGCMLFRVASNAVATLEGYVISPSIALVAELQVEVTAPPPPGRSYERRNKFVTIAWGCSVLSADGVASFPSQIRLQLSFGSSGYPCPLSYEKLPSAGSVLSRALPNAPWIDAELNLQAGASINTMKREIDTQEYDDASAAAASIAVSSVSCTAFLLSRLSHRHASNL